MQQISKVLKICLFKIYRYVNCTHLSLIHICIFLLSIISPPVSVSVHGDWTALKSYYLDQMTPPMSFAMT